MIPRSFVRITGDQSVGFVVVYRHDISVDDQFLKQGPIALNRHHLRTTAKGTRVHANDSKWAQCDMREETAGLQGSFQLAMPVVPSMDTQDRERPGGS